MVDINGKSYSDIIKIKGTDKKIDLTKLEGLQRTEQNKAIFDMIDKDKNGVISKEEARILQEKLLNDSNGDGRLTKREANRAYGRQMNVFEAISALADQQAQTIKGEEYVEQNGNTSTHIYNSSVGEEFSYKYEKTTDQNGDVTLTNPDGSQEIRHKDGSKDVIQADGTIISYDKNGTKTSVVIDGNTTTFPDANNSITKNAEGKVIQTTSFNDGVIVRTDFEYQDGKTIERQYSDVTNDAPLTGVTVREKKDGHNVDTKYATEEDMTNNRPSEIVTDGHNPTQKTVTKFTYNEDGTYTTETTNSAGEKTVKNFNADGTEIVEPAKPEAPTTHTVIKGESITKIVTDALAQQGIKNPTPEQLKEAKKEFLEANKDIVKTYKGVKKEWHGNKFFYPDDVVKIPNFTSSEQAPAAKGEDEKIYDGGTLPEVVITAKRLSPETIARKKEVQKELGDQYVVGYDNDGNIEVRNLDGEVLADKTKEANAGIKRADGNNAQTVPEEPIVIKDENGEVLPNATELANAQGDLSEEDLAIVTAYDTDSSQTLNKEEFTAMINDQLAALPPSVVETNKEQIQALIDEAFATVDAQNKDNELTPAELKQNINAAIEQLASKIDAIEQQASVPATTGVENDNNNSQTIKIIDGGNYDIKKDTTYATTTAQISNLERQLRNLETKYQLEKDEPDMKKMGFDTYNEYSNIKFKLLSLENDKALYENTMSNWKDGNTSKITINYQQFNATMRTLSNGQRAYEIEGKLYELDSAGFPDFSKEISIEE